MRASDFLVLGALALAGLIIALTISDLHLVTAGACG